MTAPLPIWVLKKGMPSRRTNCDSGSASCGRLAPAPSITSGRCAAAIMAAARSIATARRHRQFDRMRRNDLGLGLVAGDILGQFEMHRARPLLLRHAEGVAHQGRNALRRDDWRRHLGQRPHRGDDIDDLEFGLPAGVDGLLPCDHHHRHRAEIA